MAFCYLLRELLIAWAAPLFVAPSPFFRPLPWLPLHVVADWDSDFYRQNFERYRNFAWPPLYTAALSGVARLLPATRDPFLSAALVVNVVSHLVAAWFLVRLAQVELASRGGAAAFEKWLVPTLVLCWPLHNVFFAAYSESLFLALAAGCVLAYRRGRFATCSLLAALAFLTRTAGIFLIVGSRWTRCGARGSSVASSPRDSSPRSPAWRR